MSGIHSTPRIFAFIQARLGSTRFPRKVLQELPLGESSSGNLDWPGFTLLDHIFQRLRKVFGPDQIVFLIPESDRELREFIQNRGWFFYSGSEEDVWDRYQKAAANWEADCIFRLTGDNPFVDIGSIEFLKEAISCLENDSFCIAVQGLPLGMGVECFSRKALETVPESGWESRHREHVSLHIKENLSKFKVIRFSSPDLSKEEKQITTTLRLTLDESLDFQLLREISKRLGPKNPFFGAKEILELYKENPNLFATNQKVEQVTFALPKSVSNHFPITICYGNPKLYGYGHWERMKSVAIALESKGYSVQLTDSIPENAQILIWDKRDELPSFPFQKALLVDNQSHGFSHKDVTFLDLLPHPSRPSSFSSNTISFFAPKTLLWKPRPQIERDGVLLVYAGSLGKEDSVNLDGYLQSVREFWKVQSITRIGGEVSGNLSSQDRYFRRIYKSEFYKLLHGCGIFLSYFGQSLMEALYLKKAVGVFGISEIHDRLGIFASDLFQIPFLGNTKHLQFNGKEPKVTPLNMEPNAIDKVIEWLEKKS